MKDEITQLKSFKGYLNEYFRYKVRIANNDIYIHPNGENTEGFVLDKVHKKLVELFINTNLKEFFEFLVNYKQNCIRRRVEEMKNEIEEAEELGCG